MSNAGWFSEIIEMFNGKVNVKEQNSDPSINYENNKHFNHKNINKCDNNTNKKVHTVMAADKEWQAEQHA